PLGRLMALALARRLDPAEVAAEVAAQLDAFIAATGRPPDFVDGHQHVHQLPHVRDAVLDLFRDRLGEGAWLRLCFEPATAIWARGVDRLRAGVISGLGWGMARRAARAGIPVNDSFRGVHDFSGRQPCEALFERFLAGPGRRPLVMCHPGHVDDALRAVDPLTDWREAEYAWLAGEAFQAMLSRHGMRPTRFRELG
ncbi:MAG: ChbG/HpnK family deacetylase, partial [Alphaproteobacteria bacterium]|nr:ChbG/HpnK family deacetylase [Alphaproteobacteria bacterium]